MHPRAGVAQLVEHFIRNEGVPGSSPGVGSGTNLSHLSFLVIPRFACLGVLCGFLLSGCGADGYGEDPPNLSEVKKWEKVEQLIGWNFYYGDCDPPSGLFAEGGCELPLQIQNYSTCRRWAGLLSNKSEIVDFRGAKATGNGNGIEAPVEIFTGRTTVVIFAGKRSVAKSAARQLRNVRQARPSRLPPPVPGSLWGKLPCQRKPG